MPIAASLCSQPLNVTYITKVPDEHTCHPRAMLPKDPQHHAKTDQDSRHRRAVSRMCKTGQTETNKVAGLKCWNHVVHRADEQRRKTDLVPQRSVSHGLDVRVSQDVHGRLPKIWLYPHDLSTTSTRLQQVSQAASPPHVVLSVACPIFRVE
ncbi:hypothetical protein CVT26_003512 [Gymnopilus dilepis]|uniref:Uncharacterized protein n=1 Tax=Gymnopilus dilepis TaxID=231916 RepID=A0A409W2Z7_9AGAR|nr:hypothetical protein CVT26_003512 [Gymnopilus dilepis]